MATTGQMLMVLGALILFSILLPSVNRTLLYNDQAVTQGNSELVAMALAQRILAEASVRAFDVVCLSLPPVNPSQLTPVGSLGPAMGESYPNFNDLDDFNNLALVDSTAFPSVPFNIAASVDYVRPDNPSVVAGSQTFAKRLRITVTSPFLVNPANNQPVQIQLEQVFAYYL
jgi:hypothetical protein